MTQYLVAIYLPDDYDQSCRCPSDAGRGTASDFHFTHVDAVHMPLINC